VYCVIRHYKMRKPEAAGEIVSRLRAEFVPIVSGARGFASYTVGVSAGGDLVTTGFFSDKAGADESVRLASDWVFDNLAQFVEGPPVITEGEVLFHQRHLSSDHGFGVIRRIKVRPGVLAEAVEMMHSKLLPVLQEVPGFMSMAAIDAGNDEVISIGRYRDGASAAEATRRAMEWVPKNAQHLVAGPPEMIDAEIKLRAVSEAGFAPA